MDKSTFNQAAEAAALQEVASPLELDLFALEMKTRKTIHDLVAPMVDRMNSERQRLAVFNERAGLIESRLSQLEHICDVRGTKPKIFELIQNEFAEGRERDACLETRLMERIEALGMRVDNQ